MIISSCNQSISHKWVEPPKVEDKNRQVISTQSILFQTNLLWKWYHHNPYNGHTYWGYLTAYVHLVSQTSTSTQHENKHLNHLCTIHILPTSSSLYLNLSYLTLSYLLLFNQIHFIFFLSRFQLDLQMRIFLWIMTGYLFLIQP